MSHLKRLIQQNLVTQAKRRFGGAAASHASHAKPTEAGLVDTSTGGCTKDGEILFRDWTGKRVVGNSNDYIVHKLESREDQVLFDIFKEEFFGKHPTETMDKSGFVSFTPEEVLALNAVPKYSRPHRGLFGNMNQPRTVWMLPMTFTVGIVVHTNLAEFLDPEYYLLPIKLLFPKKPEAEEH